MTQTEQRFDSDTERRFAVLLADEPESLKWFKPAKGQLNIYYSADYSYEPRLHRGDGDDEVHVRAEAGVGDGRPDCAGQGVRRRNLVPPFNSTRYRTWREAMGVPADSPY